MKRKLLTIALITSGATLLIAAGPKADLNQDGQVTQAEFNQTALDQFMAADTNGDNLLSTDERKALRKAHREKRDDRKFDRLDANKDGSVTRAEMDTVNDKNNEMKAEKKASRKAKVLEKFDTNLDGTLSEAERTAIHEGREGRKGKRGDRKEKRAERPKPDANGDGFVSLDEHLALSDQLFARMDANGDGVLVKGEGRKRKGRKGDRKMRGGQ